MLDATDNITTSTFTIARRAKLVIIVVQIVNIVTRNNTMPMIATSTHAVK